MKIEFWGMFYWSCQDSSGTGVWFDDFCEQPYRPNITLHLYLPFINSVKSGVSLPNAESLQFKSWTQLSAHIGCLSPWQLWFLWETYVLSKPSLSSNTCWAQRISDVNETQYTTNRSNYTAMFTFYQHIQWHSGWEKSVCVWRKRQKQ